MQYNNYYVKFRSKEYSGWLYLTQSYCGSIHKKDKNVFSESQLSTVINYLVTPHIDEIVITKVEC